MATAYENHGTIASERINTSFGYVTFWLTAEETVDFDNNGSHMTVKLMARADYGKGTFKLKLSGNISIASHTKTYSDTYTIKDSEDTTITSYTMSIKHNVDGTKTIYSSTMIEMTKASYSFGGNIVLYDIQTGAVLSCANTYIGETATINIIKANSNHMVTIEYDAMGNTGTIEYLTKATSIEWDIPLDFLYLVTNSKELEITLTATTYDEYQQLVDSSVTTIKGLVSSIYGPIVDREVKDINPETVFLTGDDSWFIQYYSNCEFTVTARPQYGATITKLILWAGSQEFSIENSEVLTGVAYGIDDTSFYIRAYDSRGFERNWDGIIGVKKYTKLTCNLNSAEVNANGIATLNVTGNYTQRNFGAADNALSLQYRYKTNSEEFTEWVSSSAIPSIDTSNNTYEVNIEVSELDYKNDYVFEVRAIDLLDTVTSTEKIYKTTPIFDWGKNGFRFNVPVTFVDGDNAYNLVGLAKAMCNVYELENNITAGTDWTVTDSTAKLVGNNLRLYFSAARSTEFNGNMTNEEVLTFNINTEGKIVDAYNVSFSSGSTGPAASFTTSNISIVGNNLYVSVNLSAAASAGTETNAYITLPVCLNLDAY